jgi:hypothetical protein
VHRVAEAIGTRRRLRRDRVIRHTCDVKACIEPTHLRRGTHRDNARDAKERGRLAVGSRHGQAKLTEDLVEQARWAIALGWATVPLVAWALRVHPQTVRDFVSRRTWAHVP